MIDKFSFRKEMQWIREYKASVTARMRELRGRGMSDQQIAEQLNAEGLRDWRGGGAWTAQTVARALAR
jgi:Recombinase